MRRIIPAALLTGALVLAAPLAASAHVHVDPSQAKPGAGADLSFSVPNESDTATTTGVRITLPEGVGAVTAQPVDGWTARVLQTDGRDSAVRYTAQGAGVGQGATQSFVIKVAAVPDTGRIELPVAQTYSDGHMVQWDDPTPASGEEPEHPAPTVYITDTPPAEHHDGDEETAAASAAAAPAADLGLPIGLSVAALVVALGALVVGALALLRRR